MKRKQINKDTYELSKTLYGAERFKLLMEVVNQAMEDGKSPEGAPLIYTTFEKKDEWEDYNELLVDYFAVNTIVCFHLRDIYRTVLLSFSLGKAESEARGPMFDIAVDNFYAALRKFFAVIQLIDNLSEKHSVDILDHANRRNVDGYLETLEPVGKSIKISDEEMAGDFKRFEDLVGFIHKLVAVE